MKKLSVILAILFSFSIAACNKSEEAAETAPVESSAPAMEGETSVPAEATTMPAEGDAATEETPAESAEPQKL